MSLWFLLDTLTETKSIKKKIVRFGLVGAVMVGIKIPQSFIECVVQNLLTYQNNIHNQLQKLWIARRSTSSPPSSSAAAASTAKATTTASAATAAVDPTTGDNWLWWEVSPSVA